MGMFEMLERVKAALLTVPVDVFHYYAMKKPDQYIVWAESSEGDSLEADNRKEGQSLEGYIDYFTRIDKDPNVEAIQEALKSAEIAFFLNDVQREEETKYIHYVWRFEVV